MQMHHSMNQEQRQILAQTLRQSLQCLQMPVVELTEYLQEQSLSNPLLEVDLPDLTAESTPIQITHNADQCGQKNIRQNSEQMPDVYSDNFRPKSFAEHLTEQINCMPLADEKIKAMCCFLVGCLDSTGYLKCNLQEIAEKLGVSLHDVEQALYMLQMLEPYGVGARNAAECLLLQLVQSKDFNALNIRMVQEGLPLLAKRDYAGLSKLLNTSVKEIHAAEEIIKRLNPIPSQGYYTGETYYNYVVPEASIFCRDGALIIEMNDRCIPKVYLSEDYCAMLNDTAYSEVHEYLREKMTAAKSVITQVGNRQLTLRRLLLVMTQRQCDFFLRGGALQPMTMQQVAEELSLSTSTVSRAVKDKYIQFDNQLIPLRNFFTSSLQGNDGVIISADVARQQIRCLIGQEDTRAPLSDELLRVALAQAGIQISRRTVTKYRTEMNIPSASARKQQR